MYSLKHARTIYAMLGKIVAAKQYGLFPSQALLSWHMKIKLSIAPPLHVSVPVSNMFRAQS